MQDTIDHAVESLRHCGWCVIPDVLSEPESAAVRRIVLEEERLQTDRRRDWTRTSNVSDDPRQNAGVSKAENIIARIGAHASYLADERLIGTVRHILGDYVRVSSDFGIVTFPGNEREFWHADWPYNQIFAAHIPEPYGDTVMHLGSLLMLTDFTAENGGTLVVPRSHRTSRNPTGVAGREGYECHPGEVNVTGRAGSVFLYDLRLWHAVAENRTSAPRVALAVRFAPWWLNLEVRRVESPEYRLVQAKMPGRATRVQPISRNEFRALPAAVQPLYEHWLMRDEQPRGRILDDLQALRFALPMTQLAKEHGLFATLRQPADAQEVAQFLGCSHRTAEAMLALEAALGFLEADENGRFTVIQPPRVETFVDAEDPILHGLRRAFANEPGNAALDWADAIPEHTARALTEHEALRNAQPNDVVLFSNVFHRRDAEGCRALARSTFDTLGAGGWIVLHEVLLDDRKDGPLTAACLSAAMLLAPQGKQYTLRELAEILNDAGFERARLETSFGHHHVVSARKP